MSGNMMRVFSGLDDEMMQLHRSGDDAKREESDRIARLLLERADLPLVFRARACMILGCSSDPGYVEWAEEAVRIVKLGMEQEPYGEVEKQLLKDCESVLAKAKTDFQDLQAGDAGEDEEVDVERNEAEEDESGRAQHEPTGQTGRELNVDTEVHVTYSRLGQSTAPAEKKKRVRRIDSSRDQEQEYLSEEERWVDV